MFKGVCSKRILREFFTKKPIHKGETQRYCQHAMYPPPSLGGIDACIVYSKCAVKKDHTCWSFASSSGFQPHEVVHEVPEHQRKKRGKSLIGLNDPSRNDRGKGYDQWLKSAHK